MPNPLELLLAAVGVHNLEELEALAELPPIPLIRWRRFLLALVAPKISSPSANGIVAAGRLLNVTFKPDPVDLSHEVLLLPKSNPASPPMPVTVSALGSTTLPLSDPTTVQIFIPPDPVPGVQTEYYLELRIQPDLVEEQQIHRRVIKTAPPLTVALTADQPTNPPPAAPYPAATTPITFTITITGGVAPYNYMFGFGDAMPIGPVTTSTSPVVLPAHTYAPGGYTAFVTVWDSSGSGQGKMLGPFFFN